MTFGPRQDAQVERGARRGSDQRGSGRLGAAKAGLKEGDVILEFNGQKVEGWEHLKRLVRETPIHREVKMVVWRNGAVQTSDRQHRRAQGAADGYGRMGCNRRRAHGCSRCHPQPPCRRSHAAMGSMFDTPMFRTLMGTSSLGIVGEGLGQESQLAEFFGVKDGVLVRTVNKDSAAEKAGMKAGDVIIKVEDTAISTPQQIGSALRAARGRNSVTCGSWSAIRKR